MVSVEGAGVSGLEAGNLLVVVVNREMFIQMEADLDAGAGKVGVGGGGVGRTHAGLTRMEIEHIVATTVPCIDYYVE